MTQLYNRINNKILKKNAFIFHNKSRITVSFYKYIRIRDPLKIRHDIYKYFLKLDVLGRVYLAEEGVNAQISVPIEFYDHIKYYISSLFSHLHHIYFNKALNQTDLAFWVLRVKVKKKIVSDGITNINKNFFNLMNTGTYLTVDQVNHMHLDSNTIFLDIRNSYEYDIGHFRNAIGLSGITFKEQLKNIISTLEQYKNKRIVLYCTGGIRCEKGSAWMKHHGFQHIYQIQGGIIKYVRDAKKKSLPIYFEGKIFVFDARMSELVSHKILSSCYNCNISCDTYKNCKNNICHSLIIQCDQCEKIFKGCCSKECFDNLHNIL